MSDLSSLIANAPAMDWLNDSACEDKEIGDYFVEAGHTIRVEELNTCRTCPVRTDCLQHAYANSVAGGYFGGMSPGQRREMSLDQALEYIARDNVVKPIPSPKRRRAA